MAESEPILVKREDVFVSSNVRHGYRPPGVRYIRLLHLWLPAGVGGNVQKIRLLDLIEGNGVQIEDARIASEDIELVELPNVIGAGGAVRDFPFLTPCVACELCCAGHLAQSATLVTEKPENSGLQQANLSTLGTLEGSGRQFTNVQ